ncbi:hypothetical protein SY2F82_74680 [Streptomyces sp. Y2F8-2]|nr:hypothetical protein SY2F82_74680 [Streptomyces sp. Y2F8-2]
MYSRIRREVADRADVLWDVALALHADPEYAFAEHHAAALLTGELERAGLVVRREVAGMPTAFTARAGEGPPTVALLLEYDALPGLGHACGHNLIAAAGLGATLAVHTVLDALGGAVLAVGSPAEEGGGGKALEVAAGVFDGVDTALMFHPGVYSWRRAPLTAQEQHRIGFHGRAAHPTGNPTEGIDALAALIELFNVLAALGRRLPEASHVQGIVTHGGTATNIVPEYAEGLFGLRAATSRALDDLGEQLRTCAEGVALATGTRVTVERATVRYDHFRDSEVLSERFAAHLARAGIELTAPVPGVPVRRRRSSAVEPGSIPGTRETGRLPGHTSAPPAQPRTPWRPTADIRPGGLPPTQRRRTLLQPVQGLPRHRHQIRQAPPPPTKRRSHSRRSCSRQDPFEDGP